MGHIFSGEMEDFLLYGAIPMALLGVFTAMWWAELRVRERLRRHERSWLAVVVLTDAALFRTQATNPGSAPREVLVLIRVLLAWAVGVAVIWCGAAMLLAVEHGAWLALFSFGLGLGVSVRLVAGALAMCDREDPKAQSRIAGVRHSLLLHHCVVFVVGTGLLFLFVLSNQFFWNGASDHRVGQLIEFGALYGIVVLAPTALGALLVQRLRRVASYYPDASSPITADPTPT